ncbi:hypothetical protein QNH94_29040, partial [Klebsiella pneumoniae]|nr:hypothetical protein [Klebsiella pneumoniae]
GDVYKVQVISLLLVNIIPQNFKHILVFWRVKRVLPGNRVIELCRKDERLNMNDLQNKWPELFPVSYNHLTLPTIYRAQLPLYSCSYTKNHKTTTPLNLLYKNTTSLPK